MGIFMRGVKREFAPIEIGTNNKNLLENLKLAATFRMIH